ncbi:sensor histidine kinase [Conexibacter sp. CPCC 206217]|uniref:sensor histidine kinase n=1 Tax=Conexibacter sp. CPCC 206217 TaxID=3064574 RepID=UPI00272247F5|nr:sensor histidine kinase [Conexibacter sp. CPCC 206217]MDO8210384.1 histidine kinase [Conexibacter sp. CPCC 206217]
MSELVQSPPDAAAPPASAPFVPSRWQRALLPGELRGAGDQGRSARDWVVDVVQFMLAVGIGAALLATTWDDHSQLGKVLDVALGVVCCGALWWRRRHPLAIALLTGAAGVVAAAPAGAGAIALFGALIRLEWKWVAWLSLLAVVAAFVFPLLLPTEERYSTDLVFGLLFTGVVIGWALFVRVQRELVRSLQERAVRLESEQRLRVDQAREAERRRIAREMHDVLAHRVALLSLHAGALEFRPDAPPEEISAAAGVVRASARAALEDLREVIGVLREQEAEGEASAGAGGAGLGDGARTAGAPEPPQPTLVQIPALVERSRAAGMRVGCRIELGGLDGAAVGDVLGRTAYRIVQEGLTNAHKHAPAAAVEVLVEAHDGTLVVEVVSRRSVGAATAEAAARGEQLPGTGIGLVGLAERVALAGGELEHGPDTRGDFVLRATLPWESR